MEEQVQCSLYYPGRGFEYDKIRLAGLELSEWRALQEAIRGLGQPIPHLSALFKSSFPITLARAEVLRLAAEFEKTDLTGQLNEPALGAYFTLGMFLSQASEQREAGAAFDID